MLGTAKLKGRCSRVSVTVDAEVTVSIDDVPSEDLIRDLTERKAFPTEAPKGWEMYPEGTLDAVAQLIDTGRCEEARLYVERVLHPKWKTEESAASEYRMAIRSQESLRA